MANLTEVNDLERLILQAQPMSKCEQIAQIRFTHNRSEKELPIWSITLGSSAPEAPCLILTAGVHGLERVGSHVCIQFLFPLFEQLKWDKNLQDLFSQVRLVTIPIVNPGGMFLNSRSNPNGVDIMRNAHFEGEEKGLPYISGHYVSPSLPWYRGKKDGELEVETKALIEIVRKNVNQSRFAISLDIHSGFGMRDRVWYPWSASKKMIPDQVTVEKIEDVFRKSHPFHFYKIESQTSSYVIHGDPWDYLYDEHLKTRKADQIYIPFALEMGSWTWLRKNPGQFFRRDGIYNPIIPHRYNRIMRRHRPMLDFLLHMVANHQSWN